MRLTPSEPDVRTLIGRIADSEINLQPDFQRGEVWTVKKKQRLIDTILREWHIPPVHLIELPNRKQEVLDGQQRLIAVRDFANDQFPIDGSIEPPNSDIEVLDGKLYSQLPDAVRRQFNQYPIRVIGVTDYNPAEVGELFLRLNQPANLTTAEQRNAFFGPARSQVKELVTSFRDRVFTPDAIGFSNSRMAYDDVVARFCFTLEANHLWHKVGATDITAKYRSNEGFDNLTLRRATAAIDLFGEIIHRAEPHIKFNKATLFSWLVIYDTLAPHARLLDLKVLAQHLSEFEICRNSLRTSSRDHLGSFWHDHRIRFLVDSFNDRASARVADVMSVVVRDFVLVFTLLEGFKTVTPELRDNSKASLKHVAEYLNSDNPTGPSESDLESILSVSEWRSLQ